MGDIARPALAEVLAAITDRPVGHWRAEIASPAFLGVERISSTGVRWSVRVDPFRSKKYPRHAPLRSTEPAYEARRVGNTLTRVEVSPAHTITPAEAVEALAGLWPWEPGDERAPRWWCDGCEGTGLAAVDTARGRKVYRCGECDIAGHTADPPTLAALVAVASLGAGRLARYVHLAGEIARAAGCAGASVVWRPMTREAIEEMRKAVSWGVAPSTIVEASIQSDWYASDPRVASSAWGGWRPGVVSPEINEVMPMLRDLHAGGVRLVGLDAHRIVLAVEAIGGDRG